MINDERRKAMTQQLATLVEETLIAEVTLSPKPGSVDALDMGAHSDMDCALFLKSAETLTFFSEEMAQAAWQHAIDQKLKEKIAEIGRKAEKTMLIVTDGINTYKRAIWAIGLLTGVTAQKISVEQPFSLSKILGDISKLAAFPDTKYRHKKNTHGRTVKQEYGVNGAHGETMSNCPHIRLVIQAAKEIDSDSDVQERIHILLVLISPLDNACILHRGGQKMLMEMQELAHATSQSALPNHPFITLLHFCQENQISPGGSADLLSASLFALRIKEIWTASTYACPMSLND